ncbi:MAG: protease complex subunit PrcB family protein [Elusimicrobia bacterium]|nr:protease complex subunit PrcB family protein [Elusimicrobiota bacterium]
MKTPLILAFLASAAFADAPAWQTLTGDASRVADPRAVVVSDPKAWGSLWNEHAAEGASLPAVDFQKERVVAVFLGLKKTGGWQVDLTTREEMGALVVEVAEQAPKDFALTQLTTPFVFQKVSAAYPKVNIVKAKKPVPATAPSEQGSASLQETPAFGRAAGMVAALNDLRDAPNASRAFDGGAVAGGRLAQLPPPPGGGNGNGGSNPAPRAGKPLPPPPGGGLPSQGGGKPLPPPPGGGDDDNRGGKPLPPPPGGGKPLPPPPGSNVPKPTRPGGPLPRGDRRLDDAERTFFTQGMDYIGYWRGSTSFERAVGHLTVKPGDAGKSYVLKLVSSEVQEYTKFYRNPATDAYYWMPASESTGFGVTRRLDIDFGARALQPWESESFTFSLESRSLSLESQSGAFQYTLTTNTDPRDPETVHITLNAGAKRLTAPDSNGVSASLVNVGGRLKLAIDDKWAAEYAGETFEVAAVVRQDDGSFFRRDPTVYAVTSKNPLKVSGTAAIDITGGAGTFYLESWSFRRAGSKISSAGWVNKGAGNRLKK